ncbi:MAG: DUF5666 domain-containing protein [Candidatus Paceibacterota bacterium]
MKKYLIAFAVVALVAGLTIATGVAKANENENDNKIEKAEKVKPNVKDVAKNDLRQELSIREIVGRVICQEVGNCPTDKPSTEVLIKAAKVTSVGTDTLGVSVFSYAYTIDTKGAKIVRQFWGTSNVTEFSVGDVVNVAGSLDASNNFLVHAKTVRNVSIQAKHGVFKGTVESVNASSSSFVLKTEERGNQTVNVTADTKITKGTTTAAFADIQVGTKLLVRGIWNKALAKIQAILIDIKK